MRIALPLADGCLAMHFGHCDTFALVDVEKETGEIRGTTLVEAPPHQPGLLPAWLHDKGASVIIAGGMGSRAQALFADRGIEVVIGAPSQTPEQIVRAFLAGELVTGANVCDH